MRLAPVARRCAARYSPSAPPFFNASQKRGSSPAVRPPSGCCRAASPPLRERRHLYWGSGPLQHHQMHRLLPRGSILGYHPRPRFLAVLAGILPVHPFRAYFIPEALLGFSLQGVPLERRPESSSLPGSPLVVPTVATASFRWVPRTPRQKAWVDFRGLLSVRVRSRYRGPLRLRHGRSPPGFLPP